MKTILKSISGIGLALSIVPSFLVLNGSINMNTNYIIMIIGMILWFGSAPFWMSSKPLEEED